MTAEEVLAKAARIVEAGWYQGGYVSPDGTKVCAMGAIRVAAGERISELNSYRPSKVADPAIVALSYEVDDVRGIGMWNDTPGRTAEEVATTLRNAKRHLHGA